METMTSWPHWFLLRNIWPPDPHWFLSRNMWPLTPTDSFHGTYDLLTPIDSFKGTYDLLTPLILFMEHMTSWPPLIPVKWYMPSRPSLIHLKQHMTSWPHWPISKVTSSHDPIVHFNSFRPGQRDVISIPLLTIPSCPMDQGLWYAIRYNSDFFFFSKLKTFCPGLMSYSLGTDLSFI